jgi:tetratricopeptide (TPR) repeat protein
MSFVTGWVVHVFFYQDKPEKDIYSSKIECSNSNDSSNPKIIEKIVIKELIKFVPKTKIIYRTKEKKADSNSSQDLFLLALEKNEFDEAMNYYQDAEEKKHSLYQMALFGYFEKLEKKEPLQTIEQMQSFIEIEPESKLIVFQLAQFFKMKNKYQDALNLIIDFSYVASYEEKNSIYNKIKSISLEYIQKLNSTKSFQILIDFLINRIETAVLSDFIRLS